MESKIKPENYYKFFPLTRETLEKIWENDTTTTCYVEKDYPTEKFLSVRFHQDILAILPYSEISIYAKNETDYNFARKFVGKTIRVKVTKIDGQSIFVSRKANMKAALDYLKQCEYVTGHVFYVTDKYAWADIGNGVTGFLAISETCNTFTNSVHEYLYKGKIVRFKIIGFDEKGNANISYKQDFTPKIPKLGTMVECRVKYPVNNVPHSYFAAVNHRLVGIVNKPYNHPGFQYGDRIRCIVIGFNEQGLKLKFWSTIK